MPVLGAAHADDHLVLDHERGEGDGVGQLRVGDGDVPDGLAVLRIDRDEVGVQRAHVQHVAVNGDAAVVGAAAHPLVGRVRVAVLPEHAPGPGIQRQHVVGALRDVHEAVHDDRRGLPGPEHLALQDPLLLQVPHVERRDLPQHGVALAGVPAGIRQPVLGFLRGTQQAIRCHLGVNTRRDARGESQRGHQQEVRRSRHRASHGHSPFSVVRYAITSASSSGVNRPW